MHVNVSMFHLLEKSPQMLSNNKANILTVKKNLNSKHIHNEQQWSSGDGLRCAAFILRHHSLDEAPPGGCRTRMFCFFDSSDT